VLHHGLLNYVSIFKQQGRYWWFTTIILATWEAEIGRIMVGGQPRQKTKPPLLPAF
jgi:hypothetical protein